MCHKRLGYIVHHKIELTQQNVHNPEIALNWDNFSYECKRCHDQHEGHGVGHVAAPLVEFDAEGNAVRGTKERDAM